MKVKAVNYANAKTGDTVLLSFGTSKLLKATFLLYVFPVLCMLAGAVTGHKCALLLGIDQSTFSAICGFSFFFISILVVKLKGNSLALKDDYKPKIIKTLKSVHF